MASSDNEKNQTEVTRRTRMLLKSQAFPSLLQPDDHSFDFIKSHRPISKFLSPLTVMKVLKTGSRAEQVYIPDSDIDYMYEIGPMTITDSGLPTFPSNDFIDVMKNFVMKGYQILSNTNTIEFKCFPTENPGFYRIIDKDGGYVYPLMVQSIVSPIIDMANKLSMLNKPFATLKKMHDAEEESRDKQSGLTRKQRKMVESTNEPGIDINDQIPLDIFLIQNTNINNEDHKINIRIPNKDEDVVIALRLTKWPQHIWKEFIEAQPDLLRDQRRSLEDEDLYLVGKSHPDSQEKWIEWRISFSLPEIKIISTMPYLYRKIYIIFKRKLKVKLSLRSAPLPYASYIAKTVFLWKYDDWIRNAHSPTEDDLSYFVQDLLEEVLKCYKERHLPMYFLPKMNVLKSFETSTEENFNKVVEHLDKLVKGEPVASIPFRGVWDSISNELYFNTFFDSEVNKCSSQPLKELFDNAANATNADEIREYSLDLLNELYQMFLYYLFVQMHYPTNALKGFSNLPQRNYSNFKSSVLSQTYQQIHGFTLSVLYLVGVFGSDYIEDEDMEKTKAYYTSLSEFLDKTRPVEATGTVIDYYLQQLFFQPKGFEISDEDDEAIFKGWITGDLDEEIYCNIQKEESDRSWKCFERNFRQIIVDNHQQENSEDKESGKKREPQHFAKQKIGEDNWRSRLEEITRNIKKESEDYARLVLGSEFFKMDELFQKLVDKLNTKEMIERRMKTTLSNKEVGNLKTQLRGEQEKLSKAKNEIMKDALKSSVEKLNERIERKESESYYTFNQLMLQQCEMYNYGFTPKKFALPTPSMYLLYLSQHKVNHKYTKRGIQLWTTFNHKMVDWGYHIPNKDGSLEYVTNHTRKHNSFLRGYEVFEKDGKKRMKPYKIVFMHQFDDRSRNQEEDPYHKLT